MRKLIVVAYLFLFTVSAHAISMGDAIARIRPGALWTLVGNDYSTLVWLDAIQTQPTLTEVTNAMAFYDTPQGITETQRSQAVDQFSNLADAGLKRDRAIVLVARSENNLLREWIESFKAAVAASTSLADLKTRVAALPAMPDRSLSQAKTAIVNEINSGESD